MLGFSRAQLDWYETNLINKCRTEVVIGRFSRAQDGSGHIVLIRRRKKVVNPLVLLL